MPTVAETREWLEHTGELELQVRAASLGAVFEEASMALAELLGEPGDDPAVRRPVCVQGPDLPALLAIWLEELVWLAESESLIAERVEGVAVRDGVARGTVVARSGRPRALVKAVTYHDLTCERAGDGWRATVVLDV
jgi:SHS2 domain-containing protein